MLLRVPIGGPFPDVSDHVVNTIAVRCECGHRRRPFKTVFVSILSRKLALPCIRLMFAAWREFVAPGVFRAVEAAPRGIFPFGFGRQILACPVGVGERIRKRDMHHRMIVEVVDITPWPIGDDANSRLLETSTILPSYPGQPDVWEARTRASRHRAYAEARRDSPLDRAEFLRT